MKKNEGTTDRWLRAILGLVILYISYSMLVGTVQIVGYVIGAILVITSITGFCLLYEVLGINTKKE